MIEKNNLKTKLKESPKEFILEFFKEAKIKEEEGVLTISEVKQDFEDFIGKKSPYKLVFDLDLHNKVKESELIMKGSYFLLAIRDYLSNKGQTSLLKINIKITPEELSKRLKLRSCKNLVIKTTLSFLYEFSFLSTYQYLNDKKQSINRFLVKDKEILDLDISKLKTQKGKEEEIFILDPLENYLTAKKVLDKKVTNEIKPIKALLKKKLEKELFRVKDHYFKQIKEKDEEVETCMNKIKMLQSRLRHTSYERDVRILERTIRESKERLEGLKKRSYKERLKTEEAFHINDEVEKHVLSIKNLLINITLFYYPIYEVIISNKVRKYDPILDKVF
jgi:hypothetical protein